MRPSITPAQMLVQLQRLHDLWPKFDLKEDALRRMAGEYARALEGLDAEAVAGAVSIWIRTMPGPRWPSPVQVREHAAHWMAVNRALPMPVNPEEDHGGCKTCRAPARWAVLQAEDWRTGTKGEVERMIRPCYSEEHRNGSPMVPFPPNFIRWAPTPPHQHGTQPTKADQGVPHPQRQDSRGVGQPGRVQDPTRAAPDHGVARPTVRPHQAAYLPDSQRPVAPPAPSPITPRDLLHDED